MATTVSSRLVANNIVRAGIGGIQGVYIEYTTTATVSLGTVIRMVPVPHGARIVDLWVKVPGQGSAGSFNVGISTNPDLFLASETQTAARPVVRANLGLPHDVSVSDLVDGPLRYRSVDFMNGNPGSDTNQAGAVFGMYVEYIVGEPQDLS
jgi:hypothetical protein